VLITSTRASTLRSLSMSNCEADRASRESRILGDVNRPAVRRHAGLSSRAGAIAQWSAQRSRHWHRRRLGGRRRLRATPSLNRSRAFLDSPRDEVVRIAFAPARSRSLALRLLALMLGADALSITDSRSQTEPVTTHTAWSLAGDPLNVPHPSVAAAHERSARGRGE
jgi:hypothetical protein